MKKALSLFAKEFFAQVEGGNARTKGVVRHFNGALTAGLSHRLTSGGKSLSSSLLLITLLAPYSS